MNDFILAEEANGNRYVQEYTKSEMAEVFSEEELDQLDQGEVVERDEVRFVDLVAVGGSALDNS
mgnify:CR=1 FL=1